MFFIMDSVPMLYEDPSTAPLELTYVKWFCEPTHATAANGGDNKTYDSLVARVVSYLPISMLKKVLKNGAVIPNGLF